MRGLSSRLRRVGSISVTALIYALWYLNDTVPVIKAVFQGLFLGYVVVRTHSIHNVIIAEVVTVTLETCLLCLWEAWPSFVSGMDTNSRSEMFQTPLWMVVSVVGFFMLLFVLHANTKKVDLKNIRPAKNKK